MAEASAADKLGLTRGAFGVRARKSAGVHNAIVCHADLIQLRVTPSVASSLFICRLYLGHPTP
jgi:hypothetical protein